ncbi:DUF2281 domain-containing protein [Leptolyngbya sp. PCC 6406]|uniref:DUF2281 domain-containing protein n=1 Tax=Leptolyngbya sp. PCC 6406 TaxID=1173264 RepID=UPI0002ACFB15|nr:DUF2281 domain-containing protein [Leptolyngbya sp. PCC 6406]
MKFKLFDTVQLTESIATSDDSHLPLDTIGTVVEILNDGENGGEAYLVELFGDWVKYDSDENLIATDRNDPDAFIETLAVAMVSPHQIRLLKPASETVGIRAQLLALIEELSDPLLQEIADFAEFLKQKVA